MRSSRRSRPISPAPRPYPHPNPSPTPPPPLEFKEALAYLVAEEARLGRRLRREEWPEVLQAAIVLPADAMSVQRMVGERLVATVAVELVDRWERMYGLLQAYHAREGSANVPDRHEEGGEQLGTWLSTQRTMHKAGRYR